MLRPRPTTDDETRTAGAGPGLALFVVVFGSVLASAMTLGVLMASAGIEASACVIVSCTLIGMGGMAAAALTAR